MGVITVMLIINKLQMVFGTAQKTVNMTFALNVDNDPRSHTLAYLAKTKMRLLLLHSRLM